MDDREFCAVLRIESRVCATWVERRWITPQEETPGRRRFSDVDVARARLLIDLEQAMGVNAEGIDVIVHLVDQIYGMRATMSDLVAALAAQPEPVRERILAAARRLDRDGEAN